jgi:hypothetical protein
MTERREGPAGRGLEERIAPSNHPDRNEGSGNQGGGNHTRSVSGSGERLLATARLPHRTHPLASPTSATRRSRRERAASGGRPAFVVRTPPRRAFSPGRFTLILGALDASSGSIQEAAEATFERRTPPDTRPVRRAPAHLGLLDEDAEGRARRGRCHARAEPCSPAARRLRPAAALRVAGPRLWFCFTPAFLWARSRPSGRRRHHRRQPRRDQSQFYLFQRGKLPLVCWCCSLITVLSSSTGSRAPERRQGTRSAFCFSTFSPRFTAT